MKSDTVSRFVLINFLQLSLASFVSLSFYYFFTYFIKLAVFNLIKVYSFKVSMFDRTYARIVGLDFGELFLNTIIMAIIIMLMTLLITYLFYTPFKTAMNNLHVSLNNPQLAQNEKDMKIFLKNTKVVHVTSLFINYLKGNVELKEKIHQYKQLNHYHPFQFFSLYLLTLIPVIISFGLFIYHLSFTYETKIMNVVTTYIDANSVIATNIDKLSSLMYLISFFTILVYVLLLYFYSRYVIRNYVGASYSFVKTLCNFTEDKTSARFHFRSHDPALPVLPSLNDLEAQIKSKL